MNESKPAAPSPFEGLPERKPFTATRREIWTALAMYFAAYLYIDKELLFTFGSCTGTPSALRKVGSGSAALR